MTDPAFYVDLGNGVYISSNGDVRVGSVPNKPIYKSSSSLPIDPKKIENALKGVKDALSGVNKSGALHDALAKNEYLFGLLTLLSIAGKVAGMIAPVFAVASFAVDALKILGVIKEGPSAFEQMINQQIQKLLDLEIAIKKDADGKIVGKLRADVTNATDSARSFARRLTVPSNELGDLQNERDNLFQQVNAAGSSVLQLLDVGLWTGVFQYTSYTGISRAIYPTWGGGPALFAIPGALNAATPQAVPIIAAPDGLHFDPRLMFPNVTYSVLGFLAALRVLDPEYRTTSSQIDRLRSFAKALDNLSQALRSSVLTRTIYKPEHFSHTFSKGDVTAGFLGIYKLRKYRLNLAVGAIDLVSYDDSFIKEILTTSYDESKQIWQPASSKIGFIDLYWQPPAILAHDGFGGYKIINKEDCALAANEQSESDYAKLLATSGYADLRILAALLRNEATEPDVSQTVSVLRIDSRRQVLPSKLTTITSGPFDYTGEIVSSSATRIPQDYYSTASFSTQPIRRAHTINYRILLRTLDIEQTLDNQVEYADFYRTMYDNDPSDTSFKTLTVHTNGLEVDAVELIGEWTGTPFHEPIQVSGEVELIAKTFEWWIPDYPKLVGRVPDWRIEAELRAAGSYFPERVARKGLSRKKLGSGIGPLRPTGTVAVIRPMLPGKKDWDGQIRSIRREKISLQYSLYWNADRLMIDLVSRNIDRCYDLYVVVQEQMQGSQNVLHTPAKVSVNGMLVYVSPEFFQKEADAFGRSAAALVAQVPKHIPKIGDPIPRGGINRDHAKQIRNQIDLNEFSQRVRSYNVLSNDALKK